MPRLSKIVTRTGDTGTTGLGDGSRVNKYDLRIELIGTIDELNAQVGIVLAYVKESVDNAAEIETLLTIQHHLFDLGGELSIPGNIAITADKLAWLDSKTESMNDQLSPLREFVLPGGTKAAAHCHGARTVARRAERQFWQLCGTSTEKEANLIAGQYLNRLSDFLFVMSRYLNLMGGELDILWNNSNK